MTRKILALILLSYSASFNLFADDLFVYKFRFLTYQNESDCSQKISDISVELSKSSGVQAMTTYCEPDSLYPSYFSGIVNYKADSELNITTSDDNLTFGEDRDGPYLSSEECEGDLQNQVDLFSEATGLMPFVAMCHPIRSYDSKARFTFKIDAIGSSDVRANLVGISVYGKLVSPLAELMEYSSAAFEAMGAKVRSVSYRTYGYWRRLTIGYYGVSRISPYPHLELAYDKDEDCLDAYAKAKNIYSDESSKPLALFCENNTAYRVLNIYHDYSIGNSSEYFRRWKKGYQELSACNTAVTVELEKANANLQNPYIGGLCGIENGNIVMFLLKSLP